MAGWIGGPELPGRRQNAENIPGARKEAETGMSTADLRQLAIVVFGVLIAAVIVRLGLPAIEALVEVAGQ